jgi:hypothetical protein
MGETIYVIDPARCTECVGHFDDRNAWWCARSSASTPIRTESRKSLLAKLRRCSGHPELYLRSLPE